MAVPGRDLSQAAAAPNLAPRAPHCTYERLVIQNALSQNLMQRGTVQVSYSADNTMAPVTSVTSTEAPQQYQQSSRKGKKAWRKNVDISEVQTGLQKAREEISQGLVSSGAPKYLAFY